MSESNSNKSNGDSKKITITLILILTLMITTTGGTYAYFAFSASNTTTVTGTAGTANVALTVTKIKPATTGSGVMVPQLSYYKNGSTNVNVLKLAIDNSCIDGNSNQICQVYNIVVQNTGTSNIRINTTFALAGGTFNHLKWFKLAEGTGSTPTTTYTYPSSITAAYGNLKTVTSVATKQHIPANNYYYYVIGVWIEETGEDQGQSQTVTTKKDQGTFTGTVGITASDMNGNNIGGVTSTITGASA